MTELTSRDRETSSALNVAKLRSIYRYPVKGLSPALAQRAADRPQASTNEGKRGDPSRRGPRAQTPDARPILREHLGAGFDEPRFVCANAYQGAFEIAEAIRAGAQVVVTGRVADPSLTVGPAMAHFGWTPDDWDALAGATMAGHLLE